MKLLPLITALALTLPVFARSEAAQARTQRDVLPHVEINGQTSPLVGVLQVDEENKFIRVEFFEDTCGLLMARPEEIHCLAEPELTKVLMVPLEKTYISGGSRYYSGDKDESGQGGLLTEIAVQDHRQRTDPLFGLDPVELIVDAKVTDPKTGETTTYHLEWAK